MNTNTVNTAPTDRDLERVRLEVSAIRDHDDRSPVRRAARRTWRAALRGWRTQLLLQQRLIRDGSPWFGEHGTDSRVEPHRG